MGNRVRLGVNIDHCATLRQVRGGTTDYPDLIQCAQWAKQGGANLITIHLREDRRHIQDQDVKDLCRWRGLPINLELASQDKMIQIGIKNKPNWVCLVPEKRQELTTEGGLDVFKIRAKLKDQISDLIYNRIAVSTFIAPDLKQVEWSAKLGATAVEFHTGHWVLLKGAKKADEWAKLVKAAKLAHQLGLGVHAGHGLDYSSAGKVLKLPHLQELNIGHSLVCYSLEGGLKASVAKMVRVLSGK